MTKIIIFIRSFIFATVFYTTVVPVSIIGLVVLLLKPFYVSWMQLGASENCKPINLCTSISYLLGCKVSVWSLFLLRKICKVEIKYEGLENMPSGGCIISCQHQSALDILLITSLFRYRHAFVLKHELMKSFFGIHLKSVFSIIIDRRAGSKSLFQMINDVKDRISKDRTVIIYPHGTRIPYGVTKDVNPGIVGIYSKLNLAITPITLNTGKIWKKNGFLKYPGTVYVRIHKPIPEGLSKAEFKKIINEKMSEII